MKRYLVLIGLSAAVIRVASKSVPEWKTASFNHMEQYKNYFLSGREQLASIHFQNGHR